MSLLIPEALAVEVRRHGETAYPEEAAGLLLGTIEASDVRRVSRAVWLENQWEDGGRTRRYRLDPRRLVEAEESAERDGLTVLGVFHSHPDHPPQPSRFDLEQALPFYSYLITRVTAQGAGEMRSWRLSDDRSRFAEESLRLVPSKEEA